MLIAIIIALAVLVAFIAMQPPEFEVSRSMTMAASPDKIFPHVNDLHAWHDWSPWAQIDPNAKTTFEGATAGTGAIMRWASDNMKVGQGSMTITESRPNELVRLQLDFLKPMKGTNTGSFTFTPEGNQTRVTWSMIGQKNFISKAMNLVMSCEKMVASQFDKGLAQMKAVVDAK
jgi:Polyketide cyclase / dehydrase and lipid transport